VSHVSENNSGKFLSSNQFSNPEELKRIAQLFPYSLPIQALLAKKLKQTNTLDFDKFLKISSVMSPDRSWLYNYINQAKQEELKILNDIDNHLINEKVMDKNPTFTLNDVEILEFSPEIQSIELDKPLAEYHETEISLNPSENLEDESLILDALNSAIDHKPIEITKLAVENQPIEHKEIKTGPSNLEGALENEIMKVAIDKTIQREVDEIVASELNTNKITEIDSIEPTPEGFNYWLNPAKNQAHSREEKLKKIDALIEKFIKSEPRIVAKKVEFYSPVNVAKHSVEFNEDLVSEPLAAIFEKQGYFDKAIKAYEKLSLKFPEKRAYFATRIEKIGEIIKNIKNNK
jgi:tetratricopeptide (TPR) repeat protein